MKLKENTKTMYVADAGCFIVRREDGTIMGEEIDLGTDDSADNYTDQPYTEESYEAFYESIGERKETRKRRTRHETEVQNQ